MDLSTKAELPLDDYRRYGRQMILEGFGLPAQVKLRESSVVVVGAGGLGCPALQYLAAAGLGRIGIVDHDTIEKSNLQRQVLHTEKGVGTHKADSAADSIRRLNSAVIVNIHRCAIDASNARSILESYDLILDCTDNAATRYLLSDTAVSLGKPLVSGAAQKFEGQLCIYNLELTGNQGRGPCYRCLFPKPPAPENAGSCEDMGILGAVTGVIGTLQALEAIKVLAGLHDGKPTLLLYSALAFPPFRSVKLRNHKNTCPACGTEGEKLGNITELDYVTFCGGPRPNWEERGLWVDNQQHRITAKELERMLRESPSTLKILDVRSPTEYAICRLLSSENAPITELVARPEDFTGDESKTTIVVCRLGNDSQIAADALRIANRENSKDSAKVVDVIGGLRSWTKEVDPNFPVY